MKLGFLCCLFGALMQFGAWRSQGDHAYASAKLLAQNPPLDWPVIRAPSSNSGAQQKRVSKPNSERLKKEAEDLVQLSKSLEVTLSETNPNVVSMKVIKTAEQIETLAKKIKKEVKQD